MTGARFPFTSVVGQDDAKLALLLAAVDPQIGGVLLRGEKGTAKTTLARGLADLLPGPARFVDLPLGTTEDRLIGSLDLRRALGEQEFAFTPGLLAAADGGVLYVDEVNLLADHLVDVLLDVSVSGVNRIEREGISHEHSCRFVLVGSMNPEEGELRPQLLDRFGLCVNIVASGDPAERVEAVRRRLLFDGARLADSARTEPVTGRPARTSEPAPSDQVAVDATMDELRQRLAQLPKTAIPSDLIETAARLALAVGAEGLRADIVLCRAAAAHAALRGATEASEDDLRRVAPLVLGHRSRRNPFDPAVVPPEEIDDALDDVLDPPAGEPPRTAPSDSAESSPAGTRADDDPGRDGHGDRPVSERPPRERPPGQTTPPGSEPAAEATPLALGHERRAPTAVLPRVAHRGGPAGRRSVVEGDRGRQVRSVVPDPDQPRPLAVASTVRHLAERRVADPAAVFADEDLRHAVREQGAGALVVLIVDTSGSMRARERAEAATGTAFGLLTDAYQRRDQVAVVAFGGDTASVVLQPTGSVEVARNRLAELETGGTTPLAAGLQVGLDLVGARRDPGRSPLLVVLTDGRASGSPTALEEALDVAGNVARRGITALVLDCESGTPRLGLAQRLADAMGAACVDARTLDASAMTSMIRSVTAEGG